MPGPCPGKACLKGTERDVAPRLDSNEVIDIPVNATGMSRMIFTACGAVNSRICA